jgi:hypothetical protein
MTTLSTIQALIFIIKAIIELGQFLTGKISKEQYGANLDDMKKSIHKATTGDLETRLGGGQEVEQQINDRVNP